MSDYNLRLLSEALRDAVEQFQRTEHEKRNAAQCDWLVADIKHRKAKRRVHTIEREILRQIASL